MIAIGAKLVENCQLKRCKGQLHRAAILFKNATANTCQYRTHLSKDTVDLIQSLTYEGQDEYIFL